MNVEENNIHHSFSSGEHEIEDVLAMPYAEVSGFGYTEKSSGKEEDHLQIPVDLCTTPVTAGLNGASSPASDEQSHSLDNIVQIDIIGRNQVRVYHGTVDVGHIHAVNDIVFEPNQYVSAFDLLQLLALQPLDSLDIEPVVPNVTTTNSHLQNQERIDFFGKEFQIRFVHVPDGTLGVELDHISLADALQMNLPNQSQQDSTSHAFSKLLYGHGFRIEKHMVHHHSSGLAVGDIIVAVNDASIVLLTPSTAATLLAQSKKRKFTVIRMVQTSIIPSTKQQQQDLATEYFHLRDTTAAGRKRLRQLIREEVERKFQTDRRKMDSNNQLRTQENEKDRKINMKRTRPEDGNFPKSHLATAAASTDDEDIRKSRHGYYLQEEDDEGIEEESHEIQQQYYPEYREGHGDDNDDDDLLEKGPLHKRWCEVRRTFLCHTLYKPVCEISSAAPSSSSINSVNLEISYSSLSALQPGELFDREKWTEQYQEGLYRQKFLATVHAKDGSRDLKNKLLRYFRSKQDSS